MKNGFKTIGSLVAMSAIMIMAVSCSKEELTLENSGTHTGVVRHIEATAGMPNNHVNKAFLDIYDNNNVIWEYNDLLNINGSNIRTYDVNGTSARFRGEVRALQNTQGDKDIYWAVYPSTLAENNTSLVPANFQLDGLTVTLPATQNYSTVDEKTLISQYNYMVAYSQVDAGEENIDFQMRNLGAVLAVTIAPQSGTTLTNSHINKVVFSSENAPLSGTFTVSANSLNPTIAGVSDATSDKVTINVSDGQNNYVDISTQPAVVYAVLPPMASKNLTMRIYNTDGYFFEKTTNSATLARTHIYTITTNITDFDKSDFYFSVAADKKVLFSLGNLQWSAYNGDATGAKSTHAVAGGGTGEGTFRFSEHQWDFVGGYFGGMNYGNVYYKNASGVQVLSDNSSRSADYAGWIDLFAWATSGYNTGFDGYRPYDNYTQAYANTYHCYMPGGDPNNSLYGTYANSDWGIYNAIWNPQTQSYDPAGTWRTLKDPEWDYLLRLRPVTSGIRFNKARIHGVDGMIIVPDQWDASTYNFTCTNYTSGIQTNITNADWDNIIEKAGCVFLPIAGDMDVHATGPTNPTTYGWPTRGYYWSSTAVNNDYAADWSFAAGTMTTRVVGTTYNYGDRFCARSVRLARDI